MNIRDRVKELRRVPASDLRPNPKNWRTHPAGQADALRGILAEVGFAGAALAYELPDGSLQLIDGHLRAETVTDQPIPVLVLDVNGEEADKLLATFDPLSAMAEADAAKLDALLREVQSSNDAVNGMLADLAAGAGCEWGQGEAPAPGAGGDEFDATPEETGPTRTAVGDVWVIGGKHRLLVGDCTDAGNVARLMDGEQAGACITDPPYGIGIAANPVRQKHAKDDWDNSPASPAAIQMCLASAPAVIVWGGNYFGLPASQGFYVWDKKQPEDFSLAMCELAWTNIQSPAKIYRESVTSYQKDHPTQKPVGLISWCIQKTEGVVYDPFLGSGTTLVAAHRLGRTCYGCELEPRYADVILKRAEAEGLAVEKAE